MVRDPVLKRAASGRHPSPSPLFVLLGVTTWTGGGMASLRQVGPSKDGGRTEWTRERKMDHVRTGGDPQEQKEEEAEEEEKEEEDVTGRTGRGGHEPHTLFSSLAAATGLHATIAGAGGGNTAWGEEGAMAPQGSEFPLRGRRQEAMKEEPPLVHEDDERMEHEDRRRIPSRRSRHEHELSGLPCGWNGRSCERDSVYDTGGVNAVEEAVEGRWLQGGVAGIRMAVSLCGWRGEGDGATTMTGTGEKRPSSPFLRRSVVEEEHCKRRSSADRMTRSTSSHKEDGGRFQLVALDGLGSIERDGVSCERRCKRRFSIGDHPRCVAAALPLEMEEEDAREGRT